MSQSVSNINNAMVAGTDAPIDTSQQGRVEVDRASMIKIFQILDAGIKKEKKLVGLLSNQVEILNTRNKAMVRRLELMEQSEKDKIDEITRLNAEIQNLYNERVALKQQISNLSAQLKGQSEQSQNDLDIV